MLFSLFLFISLTLSLFYFSPWVPTGVLTLYLLNAGITNEFAYTMINNNRGYSRCYRSSSTTTTLRCHLTSDFGGSDTADGGEIAILRRLGNGCGMVEKARIGAWFVLVRGARRRGYVVIWTSRRRISQNDRVLQGGDHHPAQIPLPRPPQLRHLLNSTRFTHRNSDSSTGGPGLRIWTALVGVLVRGGPLPCGDLVCRVSLVAPHRFFESGERDFICFYDGV